MLPLFLGLLVVGSAGYAAFSGLWVRYVFAHIGGLGVSGLLACWAGAIAKKKSHSYLKAFFLGFVPPIGLGIIAVGVVYILGGHGCGGIVSIFIALAVIIFYGLAKKNPAQTKRTGTTTIVEGKGL